jgi:hypothetical protein
MARQYKISPPGIGEHCWINKPDTKFVAEGLYHTKLIYSGEVARDMRAELDALVDASFEEQTKGMKPAEIKKWSKHYPYEVVVDEATGTETGEIKVMFKQNAKIRQPDGGMKDFKLGIRDSKDKATNANVWSGSTLRVKWAPRNTKVVSTHQFGVRLDFSMVQLIKQADRKGSFGEVEGGYVDDAPDTDDAGAAPARKTNDAGSQDANF